MATSAIFCGICDLRHITNPANVWCSECDEGFCLDCKEYHSLAKATKGHNAISIAEYEKLPLFISEIKQNCREHDEKYTTFCTTHESPCCRKFVITNHKECQDIKPIEDVVQNVKSSSRFEELETLLDEVFNYLERVTTNMHQNIAEISKSKQKIETQIREFRIQINAHLDKIQTNLLNELNTVEEKSNTKIQNIITSLTKTETDVGECHANLITIKKHASDLQTYLGMQQLEVDLSTNEKKINAALKDQTVHNTSICCQFEDILENCAQKVQRFGAIKIATSSCNIPVFRRKEKQAQMKVLTAISCSIHNITLTQKKTFFRKLIWMYHATKW